MQVELLYIAVLSVILSQSHMYREGRMTWSSSCGTTQRSCARHLPHTPASPQQRPHLAPSQCRPHSKSTGPAQVTAQVWKALQQRPRQAALWPQRLLKLRSLPPRVHSGQEGPPQRPKQAVVRHRRPRLKSLLRPAAPPPCRLLAG